MFCIVQPCVASPRTMMSIKATDRTRILMPGLHPCLPSCQACTPACPRACPPACPPSHTHTEQSQLPPLSEPNTRVQSSMDKAEGGCCIVFSLERIFSWRLCSILLYLKDQAWSNEGKVSQEPCLASLYFFESQKGILVCDQAKLDYTVALKIFFFTIFVSCGDSLVSSSFFFAFQTRDAPRDLPVIAF